jgi:tetratricopeptide (TPR) repeat protein
MEDWESAEKALRRWRDVSSGLKQVGFRIDLMEGLLAEKQSKPEEAVAHLNRAIQGMPVPEALLAIARIRSSQEKWEEAVTSVSVVISKETTPQNPAWRARLLAMRAEWRTRLRDWRSAMEDIEEANRLHAEGTLVQKLYPMLESLRVALSELSDLDRSVAEARTEEAKAETLLNRSVFFLHRNWDMQAYEDAKAAFAAAPEFLYTRFWKGFCAHACGYSKEAAPVLMANDEYREWVLNPSRLEILEGIDALEEEEKQAEALMYLQQPLMALEVVGSVDGSLVKVSAYRMLGELVKARKAAARALELHPDSPEVRFMWAEVEFESGNLNEAQAQVHRIRKMDKGLDREKLDAFEEKVKAGRGGR